MKNRPCLNCQDRYPGCHSKCTKPEYLKEQARKQIIYENKSMERNGKRNTVHWANKSTGKMEE